MVKGKKAASMLPCARQGNGVYQQVGLCMASANICLPDGFNCSARRTTTTCWPLSPLPAKKFKQFCLEIFTLQSLLDKRLIRNDRSEPSAGLDQRSGHIVAAASRRGMRAG
jgi:hypothetical protein